VLTGDGSFMMTMQEIITAVRYSLPVVIIIFNNGCYLLEQHRMEQNNMEPFGTDMPKLDLVKVAKGCGAEGIRVTQPEHLHAALTKAMSLNSTVVVDIIINQEKPLFI
jgi:pyruvate dehydrogenase (quinone)/pyruvate oxidase